VQLGHPLKFLWEERAQHLTTYSNFWKQFYRKFPQYRQASVTAREFTAGERVEVDYAGDPIEWFDLKTGEIHQAWVFVAVPDSSTRGCDVAHVEIHQRSSARHRNNRGWEKFMNTDRQKRPLA
jgi:hypothetical protein